MLLIPRKERNIMNLLHEGISLLEDCYTMRVQNWKKQVFTIPNILSLFRLILIPVYIHIYLNAQSLADYHLAAAILAVSCLTDMIDGKIARHFNMISTVGKILDFTRLVHCDKFAVNQRTQTADKHVVFNRYHVFAL